MAGKFDRYISGDKPRFSADQVNGWTDASLKNVEHGTLAGSQQGRSANGIPVSNETGTDLPAFSVIQLGGPAVDPEVNEDEYLNKLAFSGETVTDGDTEKFAITQLYLPDGVIDANATVSGVCFARVTGDAGQTNATTKSGQDTLETGSSGPCVILYDPGPSGQERIAAVRIGGVTAIEPQETTTIAEGYLDEDLAGTQGAIATLSVWAVDPINGWSDTGEDVLIYNRGGFVASSGAYVVAFKVYEPTAFADNAYRPIMIGCV